MKVKAERYLYSKNIDGVRRLKDKKTGLSLIGTDVEGCLKAARQPARGGSGTKGATLVRSRPNPPCIKLGERSRCLDAIRTKKIDELGVQSRANFENCGLSKATDGIRVATVAENTADSTQPSSPMKQGGNKHKPNICAMPARSSCRIEVIEKTRQRMQAAATREDYILAGKLQKTLAQLATLQQRMKQATEQDNFILAGNLQAQLNALSQSVAKETAASMMVNSPKSSDPESGDLWM